MWVGEEAAVADEDTFFFSCFGSEMTLQIHLLLL